MLRWIAPVLFMLSLWGCGSDSPCGGCPEGSANCDGKCVDLATNPMHCSACGTECADGEACVNSQCRLLADAGAPGTSGTD